MNALYEHTVIFATLVGFILGGFSWAVSDTAVALLFGHRSFWRGGLLGLCVAWILFWASGVRLTVFYGRGEVGLSLIAGCLVALLVAKWLQIRAEGRPSS